MVEEDTNYAGNDANNGFPKQSDAMSCKEYCKSNYPSAKYFTWVSPSAPSTKSYFYNTCWCKLSDSGKRHEQGETSGEVNCGDQGNENPLLLNSVSKEVSFQVTSLSTLPTPSTATS